MKEYTKRNHVKNKNWGGKREKKIHQYHEEWARKNGEKKYKVILYGRYNRST